MFLFWNFPQKTSIFITILTISGLSWRSYWEVWEVNRWRRGWFPCLHSKYLDLTESDRKKLDIPAELRSRMNTSQLALCPVRASLRSEKKWKCKEKNIPLLSFIWKDIIVVLYYITYELYIGNCSYYNDFFFCKPHVQFETKKALR